MREGAKVFLEHILLNFYVHPTLQKLVAYQLAVVSRKQIGIVESDCQELRQKLGVQIEDECFFKDTLLFLEEHMEMNGNHQEDDITSHKKKPLTVSHNYIRSPLSHSRKVNSILAENSGMFNYSPSEVPRVSGLYSSINYKNANGKDLITHLKLSYAPSPKNKENLNSVYKSRVSSPVQQKNPYTHMRSSNLHNF